MQRSGIWWGTTALGFILGFLGSIIIQPCSCAYVEPQDYASLTDLPDAYVSLCPALKHALSENRPVLREAWNNMIRYLIAEIKMTGIKDTKLVGLYADIVGDEGMEWETREHVARMLSNQIKLCNPTSRQPLPQNP